MAEYVTLVGAFYSLLRRFWAELVHFIVLHESRPIFCCLNLLMKDVLSSNSLCQSGRPSRLCTFMSVIPNFLQIIFEYSHSFNNCVLVSFSKNLITYRCYMAVLILYRVVKTYQLTPGIGTVNYRNILPNVSLGKIPIKD
jgi:hypothetical protein